MSKTIRNLQGGDNNLPDDLYKLTSHWIKDGDSILNLGCGSQFNFEKIISKEKDVQITSIDIVSTNKPSYVDRFVTKDVEKPFSLNKKYDVVTFFELIEHIDNTDVLLRNCYRNLKNNGLLIFSFPNLASLYSRIELLLGYQPHILEISNEKANLGTGIFGRINNPDDNPIHHIRGITHNAMKDMVHFHKFKILSMIGYEYRLGKIFKHFPSLAPVNIFILKKL